MGGFSDAAGLLGSEAFRDCIRRHGSPAPGAVRERLTLAIHPHDQMLLHSLRSFDANTAVSQYFNVALQQSRAARQVLRAFFPARGADFRFLDFACGYGRLLRLLTLDVPPAQVWAAEIQPEALAFVAREFRVSPVPSSAQAERFEPGVRFDMIWVASLFSHLPRPLFHAWLERLVGALKPGGVLCFSVHDMGLYQGPAEPGGFAFRPESENAQLGTDIYGTTFVTERFVTGAVAACGDYSCLRLARGLANEQDLYVVSSRDPGVLKDFRRGPWGFVDVARVSAERQLYLTGWAASLDDGPLDAVSVAFDGRSQRCAVTGTRRDVGDALDDRRFDRSGWEYRGRLPAAKTFVEVTAESRPQETALLYAGFL